MIVDPFFQIEGVVTLYQADARLVLPALPKESVHLVVTDPPYGVNWESGFRAQSFGRMANDEESARDVIEVVLDDCIRLLRQKRHLYAFGPPDVLADLKVSAPAELIWNKGRPGAGDLSSAWGPQHERISFCVSMFRHGGRVGHEHPSARIRKGSVLTFAAPTGRNVRHPSEKPVPLLRELIESSSRQGERVLDPFAGVCSSGVAALLLGREAILVEQDAGYCEQAVPRLRAAAALWQDGLRL